MAGVSRNGADPGWRATLGRQLLILTAALTSVLYLPLAIATSSATGRLFLAGAGVVIVLALAGAARRSVSDRLRSVVVVATFLMIGSVGLVALGPMSGPGVGFAAAVAFAGLLLGRRAMYLSIVVVAGAALLIGAGMVDGRLPLPAAEDIDLGAAPTWVRSISITLVLIVIVATAVVTVIETLEQAIRQAAEEAERRHEMELELARSQSLQLIAQFAARLAHDVNNQLTVVSAWSGLSAKAESVEEVHDASKAIEEAVSQASSLTRQLLMLARRDAGTPRTLSMGDAVQRNATLLQLIAAREVDVHVSADPDAWCRIDESQLSQVVVNLTVNACEAMPGGGRLDVVVDVRQGDEVPETAGRPGRWAVLAVIDNGRGMDPDTVRRATDPFFSTKQTAGGNGLGLTTVAAILDEAGGFLRIASEPGATCVEVWIPAVEPELDLVEPPSSRRAVDLAGLQILVAEDNEAVAEAARATLEGLGAHVTVVLDGDRALEEIETGRRLDVLCTDVVMPGAPVVRAIDAFGRLHPEGTVLVCSGFVGETLLRHGIEEGSVAFLRKPFSAAQLVASIDESRRRPRRPGLGSSVQDSAMSADWSE